MTGIINQHARWYLSALFYRFTYNRLSHQLDDDLFAYLGDLVQGATVVDCGCGPGIVAQKMLQRGASRVFAIDVNQSMLRQARRRLPGAYKKGSLVPVLSDFGVHLFPQLVQNDASLRAFDVILFKRSLYVEPDQARAIVRACGRHLAPGGVLLVIHPERTFRKYVFGRHFSVHAYTPYHLFNRAMSLLADKLSIGRYTLYTRAELSALLASALPGSRLEHIPSQQQAFNMVAAWH